MIATAFATNFDALLPALDTWVTSAERKMSKAYRQATRQQQYLAGRGLLRWLLWQQWGYEAQQIIITRHENGAPLLQVDGHTWQCSISHTAGAVLVAASPTLVMGVDVERRKPRRRLTELVAQYHDGFFQSVDAANWRHFYQRWTLAEAVTKAEQGLLLETLKRSVKSYQRYAVHACHDEFILCCFSPEQTAIPLLHHIKANKNQLVHADSIGFKFALASTHYPCV